MSYRLLPRQRIRSRRIFQIIFKRGTLAKGELLNLWSCDDCAVSDKKSQEPKFAVMVSRKVSRRAVERNLWKRRIREVFRHRQSEIKKGIAILIQAKKQKDSVPSYQIIETEMSRLLAKTGSLA